MIDRVSPDDRFLIRLLRECADAMEREEVVGESWTLERPKDEHGLAPKRITITMVVPMFVQCPVEKSSGMLDRPNLQISRDPL